MWIFLVKQKKIFKELELRLAEKKKKKKRIDPKSAQHCRRKNENK